MKKLTILFIFTTLNILTNHTLGKNFIINYYHKGEIVHTQQLPQGSAISTLPELNLVSCDDKINLFVGWVTENDVTKYQTTNTTPPSFINTDYIPTTDINLYAIFADKEPTSEFTWQQISSINELKNNDQIIITSNDNNYAIGKTIENDRLTAIKITKSEDKSTITPNDNVQIFTLKSSDLTGPPHSFR